MCCWWVAELGLSQQRILTPQVEHPVPAFLPKPPPNCNLLAQEEKPPSLYTNLGKSDNLTPEFFFFFFFFEQNSQKVQQRCLPNHSLKSTAITWGWKETPNFPQHCDQKKCFWCMWGYATGELRATDTRKTCKPRKGERDGCLIHFNHWPFQDLSQVSNQSFLPITKFFCLFVWFGFGCNMAYGNSQARDQIRVAATTYATGMTMPVL